MTSFQGPRQVGINPNDGLKVQALQTPGLLKSQLIHLVPDQCRPRIQCPPFLPVVLGPDRGPGQLLGDG